jgi:hypothetical protein
MATSIISNQQVIKFNIKEMLASLETEIGLSVLDVELTLPLDPLNPTGEQRAYSEEVKYYFDSYFADYYLLIEESYCSKDGPKQATWFNCIPVSQDSQIICNYITKALTSFEGSSSTIKGKRHTSPETALKRVRKEIANAVSLEDFLRFNHDHLDFRIDLYHEHEQVISLLKMFNINVPTENNHRTYRGNEFVHCKRINLNVKKPYQMVLIVILSQIHNQLSSIYSSPCINQKNLRKLTPKLMEQHVF